MSLDGPRHPMQPIVIVAEVARFKSNAIVERLLSLARIHAGVGMNELATMVFSKDDRQQFAQLIGYSVSGYGDLSYADTQVVAAADARVEEICGREIETEKDLCANCGLLKQDHPLVDRFGSPTNVCPTSVFASRNGED